MRHQRSIEIDADRAWQAKFAMHKPASPAAADKSPATAERRLMREDSAYEGLHKGGPRTSTKTAAPQVHQFSDPSCYGSQQIGGNFDIYYNRVVSDTFVCA